MNLVDSFGRVHDDLRISVTDRCNLRCTYCMPEEPIWFPRDELLTYEELLTLTKVALSLGVCKVRLTGGEPLLRRDLPHFVAMLADDPRIQDLSLTTNGVLLDRMAGELAAAGLRRINVSLDTLDPQRYEKMTRRDLLERVLAGIEQAAAAGLMPIKVNTVLTRGLNDDEVEHLVDHARRHRWELRFIEYMPLENGQLWDPSRVISGEEVRRRIAARWPIEPDARANDDDPGAPARRFRFVDGGGRLGFIDSVSQPFCADCRRLRLTSDGRLRVCLYDDDETDLKGPLRSGADAQEIARRMTAAVRAKGRGGALEIAEQGRARPLVRTMHQIGG